MTESLVVPVAPEEKKRHPGLGFKGLLEVFVNPSGLFAKVKEDPKVLVPYLAVVLAAAGFMFIVLDYIIQAQMQTEQMQKMMERGLTREQAAGMMRVTVPLFGSTALALGPLIIGALALFWGNFVFAGKSNFKTILSVVLFGEFLFILASWVHIPLIIAKDSMAVSLSLAALLPEANLESPLYVLLSKISVFHIWEIFVLGIGFSIIFDFSRNKGMWVSVLSMGLLSMLHVLVTAIGSMFA